MRSSIVLALLLAALPIRAQRPYVPQQSRPVFRSDVDLIRVEVVAVDDRGRPVHGLTAADFRLIDAGLPRDIALFHEVSPAPRAPQAGVLPQSFSRDVASNRDPGADRLVVLAIDDMVPGDRWEQIEALGREVVEQLGDRAAVSLVFTSAAPRIEATTDHARVLRAIDQISERSHAKPRVARVVRNETGSCGFELLATLGRTLARDDHQRKALIYISPYCGAAAGYENDQRAWEMLEARRRANVALSGADPDGRAEQKRGDAAIDAFYQARHDMLDSLRRANVAFYGIDPRGPVGYSLANFPAPNLFTDVAIPGLAGEPWRPTMATGTQWTTRSFDPVLKSQEAFRSATEATGGFAVTDDRKFSEGIARIISDFDHYYTLGFYPGDLAATAFRPIEVTSGHTGLTLRYRRGYLPGTGDRTSARDADPLLALTESVLPRADLPLRLTAGVVPTAGSRSPVGMVIEVATPDGRPAPPEDDLDLRIVAVDLDGSKVVETFTRSVRGGVASAPVPADVARAGTSARYQVMTTVDLEPGRYQIRLSARSAALDMSGSVYVIVDVPKPGKDAVHLGGLSVERVAAATSRQRPVVLDRVPALAPVLDRTFPVDATLRIVAPFWRGRASAPFTAWVDLLDRHGRRIRRDRVDVGTGITTGALDFSVPLSGLPPGAYRVRVALGEGPGSVGTEVGIVATAPVG